MITSCVFVVIGAVRIHSVRIRKKQQKAIFQSLFSYFILSGIHVMVLKISNYSRNHDIERLVPEPACQNTQAAPGFTQLSSYNERLTRHICKGIRNSHSLKYEQRLTYIT